MNEGRRRVDLGLFSLSPPPFSRVCQFFFKLIISNSFKVHVVTECSVQGEECTARERVQ